MKTWYLILYLWHVSGWSNTSVGGPAISVTEAYTQPACEALGKAAKAFFDGKREQKLQIDQTIWMVVM